MYDRTHRGLRCVFFCPDLPEGFRMALDYDKLFSPRARALDTSGIRRVFELGATLDNPINLSIGQPDFPVPGAIKRAAIEAIERDDNGYTMTQGIAPLRARVCEHLKEDLGWPGDLGERGAGTQAMVTSGTSGALLLTMLALLGEGDEIIVPDPYFVAYPSMPVVAGGRAVLCDTYPDFRMTADRIEPLITGRTKAVLIDSPSNPAGVVMSEEECRSVLELCRSRGVLLVSDEIYDEFTFSDHMVDVGGGRRAAPSPARFEGAHEDVLVIRGFGKTYGCTGWRMGYAAGPAPVIAELTKMQQYSYVCSPTPLQHGCLASFGVDMRETVARYARRRDLALEILREATEAPTPGGAFYLFAEARGMTGQELFERAVERNVLVIPGNVFSSRDTHFRVSVACPEDRLEHGLRAIAGILGGG